MTDYSVMIVDDSRADRFLMSRYLRKAGLSSAIAEVTNGEEAWEFLSTFSDRAPDHPEVKPPLVILLDINMPRMNGWEFLELLEKQYDEVEIKPTPVVIITSSDSIQDKSRMSHFAHVRRYLVKGEFSSEELKHALDECVSS